MSRNQPQLAPSREPLKKPIFRADWNKAALHGSASMVGVHLGEEVGPYCECCLEQIQKQPVSMVQNTKELEFLGFGFPLYYSFVRNCIFLLIVTIFSYNIISLYQAYVTNREFCRNYKPPVHHEGGHGQHHGFASIDGLHLNEQFSFPQISHQGVGMRNFEDLSHQKNIQNTVNKQVSLSKNIGASEGGHSTPIISNGKKEDLKNKEEHLECSSWMVGIARVERKVGFDELLLRGASLVIHLILLVYIRDKLTKLMKYFDERRASPSDYSILAKDLPRLPNLRKRIKEEIGRSFKIKQIQDVILLPDFKEYHHLEEQRHHIVNKLREKVKKQERDEEAAHLEKQYNRVHQQIEKYVKENKALYNEDQLHADKAIVIFPTEYIKAEVLDRFEEKGFQSQQWQEAELEEAPEPREIIWENIAVSRSKAWSMTLYGWVLSVLVLVVLTVLFALISRGKSATVQHDYQKYEETHQSKLKRHATILVFGLIFLIVVLNKVVIANLFHKFTDLEGHASTYTFQFSFCLKYCLGLFFLTALMTLIVEAFIMHNYTSNYGVIEEETIMYFVNSIFVPLFWAVNPLLLWKLFKRWRAQGKSYYTQKEANELMEAPQYDVGKRYGEVLEVMWFTYLYMTLIPVGGMVSCLGLALYYWIDKYNLLRRSAVASNLSGNLINLTLNMLDFTLVLRTLGEMIFDYQIRDGIHLSSILFFVLSVLYQFVPVESIIHFFNEEKFEQEEKRYDQARMYFKETYYDKHLLFSELQEDRAKLEQDMMHNLTKKIEAEKQIKNLGI